MDDKQLERGFAQARAARPAVPGALMARVLADAAALQPAPVARAPRLRLWPRLFAGPGGAGALAGLAAATLAGVWFGFAQPGPAEGLGFAAPESFDLVELIPDFDALIPDAFPGADEMEG